MNNQTKTESSERILIMTGMNPQQYTEARRKLDLLPSQASWLTRPANLVGRHRPKVFRFGDWKSLRNIQQIEAALAAVEAEVKDL